MAEKLIEALLGGLIEAGYERLIAQLKLQDVVELATSIFGLTCIILGTIGAWRGWW